MSEHTDLGPSSAAPVPSDPAAATPQAPAEPAQIRQARAELDRIAGTDLPTRIAGYDEVHRLLRESMTALDARP